MIKQGELGDPEESDAHLERIFFTKALKESFLLIFFIIYVSDVSLIFSSDSITAHTVQRFTI